MSKNILAGVLVLAVLISGCSNQGNITGNVVKEIEFSCNHPYIEYKTGECCVDENSNGICDEDDVKLKDVREAPVVVEDVMGEKEVVPETCPYECPNDRKCDPVYDDEDVLTRWACT
jgi:ABC-type Fe3+-hydroxamate transport system substrate-binding protein